MKNRVLIFMGMICMSSCSLFQQIDKTKSKSEGNYHQNEHLTSTETDTGKVITTRTWSLGAPVLDKKTLEAFVPKQTADPAADQSGYKNAFLDMQQKYQDLYNLAKNGWMTMEERTSEHKGKTAVTVGSSEKSGEIKTEDSHIEKKPDQTMIFVAAGIFFILIAVLLIFLMRLSSKVNGMANFVQTFKQPS